MPTKPLRTAVFCNDTWHPALRVQNGLTPLARGLFSFEWLDAPDSWLNARLPGYDFVILAKGNTTAPDDESPWLTAEIEQALVDHVHAGKGLLCLHGGTCYRGSPKLRALTGGAFISHPPPCPVTLEPLNGHPLTSGITSSTLHDEHYTVIVDDPRADVFLHTRSAHGTQPGGWTRRENGRVCALTPGHTEDAWADPQFQKLLGACLHWAAENPSDNHT